MKGINSTYRPDAGTVCLMSAEHEDNDEGYVYHESRILWRDDMFCVSQMRSNCWPVVHKWDHILCKPISALHEQPADRADKEDGR